MDRKTSEYAQFTSEVLAEKNKEYLDSALTEGPDLLGH